MKLRIHGLPFLLLASLGLTLSAHANPLQSNPVEFGDFRDPKRVGVDPFVVGQDTLIVGFDVLADGTPISPGTFIDSTFASLGLELSSFITRGPFAGTYTHAQALNFSASPNFGQDVAVSAPNILSGYDPSLGPNASGEVAGTATLVVNFLSQTGGPGTVSKVGAWNDKMFGYNTLTAYAGPNATGMILGSVSATGPGSFFGLASGEGIRSVTFSGYSTEIDDLVFAPTPVPLPAAVVMIAPALVSLGFIRRRAA